MCSSDLSKLCLDPVQLEPVGRGDAEAAILEVERRQRFYPGAELLGRQLLLQPRSAGLPEFFHALIQLRNDERNRAPGSLLVSWAKREGLLPWRYFTLAGPSYPQAGDKIDGLQRKARARKIVFNLMFQQTSLNLTDRKSTRLNSSH